MTTVGRPQGPTDGDVALRGTARGGALNLLGSGVSALAQLTAVLVVTRGVGAETAGALFAGVSVLLIAAAVAQLGTDVSLVRHVAACRALARRRDAVVAVRTAGIAVVGVGGLLVTVALLVPDERLAVLVGGAATTSLLVLVCAVPVVALHELCLAVSRGTGAMRPTVLLERVARPSLQVLLLVVAVGWWAGPLGPAVAWVLPWAVVLPFSVVSAVRVLQGLPEGGEAAAVTSRRDFWRFSATRAAARACQVALQRVDIILVAALAGAPAAAVYTAATRFLVLGQLAATAVQQAAQPFFARLHTTGEAASLQRLLRRTTVWSVALVWPAYVVMVLCAPQLLRVFGEGYEAGAPALVVLGLAMLLATAAGPVDVVLLMAGRGGVSLLVTAAALAVDVVLCLLLIPHLGLLGAAVAWAVAIVLRNLVTVVVVARSPGATAGSRALLEVVGLVAAAVALPTGVAALLGGGAPVVLGVVPLCAAVYLWLLWRRRSRYELDLVLRR